MQLSFLTVGLGISLLYLLVTNEGNTYSVGGDGDGDLEPPPAAAEDDLRLLRKFASQAQTFILHNFAAIKQVNGKTLLALCLGFAKLCDFWACGDVSFVVLPGLVDVPEGVPVGDVPDDDGHLQLQRLRQPGRRSLK